MQCYWCGQIHSRESVRGLGHEKLRLFWVLWNGIEPTGVCHLTFEIWDFQAPTLFHLAQVMDLPAPKALRRGPYQSERSIGSFKYMSSRGWVQGRQCSKVAVQYIFLTALSNFWSSKLCIQNRIRIQRRIRNETKADIRNTHCKWSYMLAEIYKSVLGIKSTGSPRGAISAIPWSWSVLPNLCTGAARRCCQTDVMTESEL